jgi:hypothetical protein
MFIPRDELLTAPAPSAAAVAALHLVAAARLVDSHGTSRAALAILVDQLEV